MWGEKKIFEKNACTPCAYVVCDASCNGYAYKRLDQLLQEFILILLIYHAPINRNAIATAVVMNVAQYLAVAWLASSYSVLVTLGKAALASYCIYS